LLTVEGHRCCVVCGCTVCSSMAIYLPLVGRTTCHAARGQDATHLLPRYTKTLPPTLATFRTRRCAALPLDDLTTTHCLPHSCLPGTGRYWRRVFSTTLSYYAGILNLPFAPLALLSPTASKPLRLPSLSLLPGWLFWTLDGRHLTTTTHGTGIAAYWHRCMAVVPAFKTNCATGTGRVCAPWRQALAGLIYHTSHTPPPTTAADKPLRPTHRAPPASRQAWATGGRTRQQACGGALGFTTTVSSRASGKAKWHSVRRAFTTFCRCGARWTCILEQHAGIPGCGQTHRAARLPTHHLPLRTSRAVPSHQAWRHSRVSPGCAAASLLPHLPHLPSSSAPPFLSGMSVFTRTLRSTPYSARVSCPRCTPGLPASHLPARAYRTLAALAFL